jgi:endonuclease YncB( thermonuclease family)
MYDYKCTIVRVTDGDSIVVDIDLGFSHFIHGESIRLYGVDCPECRSRDKEEKAAGLLAKEFVEDALHVGGIYRLQTKEKGKFGTVSRNDLPDRRHLDKRRACKRTDLPFLISAKVKK